MIITEKNKRRVKLTSALLIVLSLISYGVPRKALLCVGNDGHVGIKTLEQRCCDTTDFDAHSPSREAVENHIEAHEDIHDSCVDFPILIVENVGQILKKSLYNILLRHDFANNCSGYTISSVGETHAPPFFLNRRHEQGNSLHDSLKTIILLI
jgi:hypothetical protein